MGDKTAVLAVTVILVSSWTACGSATGPSESEVVGESVGAVIAETWFEEIEVLVAAGCR